MKAVIPAAGKGTRLRPITEDTPKCMVQIGNKSIIKHLIQDLKQLNIEEITVVVGYLKEKVTRHLEDCDEIKFVEQEELLGTAKAVGLTSFKDPFLVVNGDVYLHQKNIEKMLNAYRSNGFDAVIGSKRVENPKEYGVLEVKNERVKNIIEKPDNPPTNLINTGIYIFKPEIYKYIQETKISLREEYEITDSIQALIDNGGKVSHQPLDNYWIDIGRKEDLDRARRLHNNDL